MAAVVSQPVTAPLTRSAMFLVVTLKPGPEHDATVRASPRIWQRCCVPSGSANPTRA